MPSLEHQEALLFFTHSSDMTNSLITYCKYVVHTHAKTGTKGWLVAGIVNSPFKKPAAGNFFRKRHKVHKERRYIFSAVQNLNC